MGFRSVRTGSKFAALSICIALWAAGNHKYTGAGIADFRSYDAQNGPVGEQGK